MIELPEAINLAKQINERIAGRKVEQILPPTKPHKLCWFNGEPEEYERAVKGAVLTKAEGFGIFVEIHFDNGLRLCISDGINLRLIGYDKIPEHYQLLIRFDDGNALVFTVAMYGGICLHDRSYDNPYYLASQSAVSPFSQEFSEYFEKTFEASKPGLSAKAFLATEQRFPGIGNGVLQDILFSAKIHPKRKISTFNLDDQNRLLHSIVDTIEEMIQLDGRDTEKSLLGEPGGYETKMSKNTVDTACTVCGTMITKENYMGGSIYFCPTCQF